MTKNKNILVIVSMALILIGVFYLFTLRKEEMALQENEIQTQKSEVTKTNVDFSKLPDKFPENIPLEKDAKTTQNYNSITPEGSFQATRTFETKLSLSDNFTLYSDFLKSDGWKIEATTNDTGYKMISASKDRSDLIISIDENKGSKVRTVSISYGQR